MQSTLIPALSSMGTTPMIIRMVYIGTRPDAPPCPFGHRFKWIGFDKEKKEYVRVTKSVFKRLISSVEQVG